MFNKEAEFEKETEDNKPPYRMEIIKNPIIEMKINKADFNEQDILVFPHNRRAPENLSSVIKFLFGDVAVATEYYVDNFSFLKITGANYILKDVKTLNADFIVKEVKTREVIK